MTQYSLIADLFRYPDENFSKEVLKITDVLINKYPQAAKLLSDFETFISNISLSEIQEYYVKTFEVKALCDLDVGYVLFGEDYKRGQFLVNIQSEHVKAGNDCGSELGDYLPNMLRLLPKIENKEFAQELAYSILMPAIEQMQKVFLDKTNIYLKVLQILTIAMEMDFTNLKYEKIVIISRETKEFYRKPACNTDFCKPQKKRY